MDGKPKSDGEKEQKTRKAVNAPRKRLWVQDGK